MAAGTERSNGAFCRDALAGTRFAVIDWVAETGSTNDDLAELAAGGAPEQVLVTDLQTAGRGRRGRVWDAPSESSILMSLLIRGRTPQNAFWSVAAVATAASQAIGELIDVPCSVKWPNDVLIGEAGSEKKVAGVLASVVDDAVIVGIGINVNWPDDIPTDIASTGTAVNQQAGAGANVDRAALVTDILQRVICHLDGAAEALRQAWLDQCSTIGRPVRIELAAGHVEGVAVGITPDGAVIIESAGERQAYHVGDVVHLRPTDTTS